MAAPDDNAATVGTPNGGSALRCKAKNRRGERCAKPARQGFEVCATHGAGSRKREDSGEKRPVGRPIVHGLYSKTPLKNLEQLRAEVVALEIDLDDTDGELVTIKSVVWHLLSQAEMMNTKTVMLEAALEAIEKVLEEAVVTRDGEPGPGELTPAQAKQVAGGLVAGSRLLGMISSWTDRLLESNFRVIQATKLRAEIRAKLAEEEAVAEFAELAKRLTQIIWQMSPDDEFLDAYEARVQRELFGPLGLALPEVAEA